MQRRGDFPNPLRSLRLFASLRLNWLNSHTWVTEKPRHETQKLSPR
jgi:hypothetical protein